MSGKLVLVTGVTGFIAGHVVNELLIAGYRVRGTTRGAKAQKLRESIKVPGLEFVQVDDVASSDLTEALKDVYAVIHVASPLPGRTSVEDTLKSAEEGTLHVLKATVKAGIEKIVITSSIGVIMEPNLHRAFSGEAFNGSEWGSVTKEEVEANAKDPFYVYFASKIFAERAVWKFAESHPQLDIATILPAFVYGPFAPRFPFPAASGLGTNGFIYQLLSGGKPPMMPPAIIDVRDAAKAHVLALNVPRKALEQKRYLIGGGLVSWRQAAALLREVRPKLKTLAPEELADLPGPTSTYDCSRAEQDLGIEFINPEDTITDAVDSLLEVQKTWAA